MGNSMHCFEEGRGKFKSYGDFFFKLIFFLKVISTHSARLELTTQRSRVTCFTCGVRHTPKKFSFLRETCSLPFKGGVNTWMFLALSFGF